MKSKQIDFFFSRSGNVLELKYWYIDDGSYYGVTGVCTEVDHYLLFHVREEIQKDRSTSQGIRDCLYEAQNEVKSI